jgi:uncharacterized protein (TIGR02588 family)
MAHMDHDDDDTARNEESWIEWIIACFALVLVLTLIVYLAVMAWTAGDSPPNLLLSAEHLDPARPGYVEVTVHNDGRGSAADVQIEGTLPDGESSEATLDYSPANSEAQVTLVFTRPVQPEEVTLQVKGFSDP